MSGRTIDLATLKNVKNTVIGNPTAKATLAKDETFVARLVDCINNPLPYLESSQGSEDDIRIEAAHVVSSLSYGSNDALKSLLSANAHQAFIYAISALQPTDKPTLLAAFTRALKALTSALADAVGPSQMGLHDFPEGIQEEARSALDFLFEMDVLDVYLPLLADKSQQTAISTAHLLASALRSQSYRAAVSEWLPASERHKEITKGKRGWERSDTGNPITKQGGWVAKHLVTFLQKKDSKLQEAALSALASLAKENHSVATKLARTSEQPSMYMGLKVLCPILTYHSRCTFYCIDIMQVEGAGPSDSGMFMRNKYSQSRLLQLYHPRPPPSKISCYDRHPCHEHPNLSTSEPVRTRAKACFVLCQLINDDKDLCQLAFQRGTLTQLAHLIKSITPSESNIQWDEDEPESQACLREAAFTTIAAIALFDNDIRSEITDRLCLVPYIMRPSVTDM
ncbi:hypothetical protein QCA50_003505 [Cerrena zonata]|uniref:ARM repeat superfamily protein n=1 Tax=Cerrena zonata TaxID=2478898 RepID=A0AAW0GWF9_9APHY